MAASVDYFGDFILNCQLQENGVVHMEKTADKWGKSGQGDEWQEKWFEHYDATGKSEKWAHKWCSLDRNTPLDVGHAHVWHERYDILKLLNTRSQ